MGDLGVALAHVEPADPVVVRQAVGGGGQHVRWRQQVHRRQHVRRRRQIRPSGVAESLRRRCRPRRLRRGPRSPRRLRRRGRAPQTPGRNIAWTVPEPTIAIRLEQLTKHYAGRHGRGRRAGPRGPPRRDRVPRGPVGLRQVDDPAHGQPADRADQRAGHRRRRRRHDRRPGSAPPPDRVRHPVRRAATAPQCRRQRRDRAQAARLGPEADPVPGRRAARPSSGSTPPAYRGRYPAELSGGQQQRVGRRPGAGRGPPGAADG